MRGYEKYYIKQVSQDKEYDVEDDHKEKDKDGTIEEIGLKLRKGNKSRCE